MALSTFWDKSGKITQLESFPDSFQHWETGQTLDRVQQTLLQRVEKLLARKAVRTELRSVDRRNRVLEIEYEGGHQDILRMPEVTFDDKGEITQDVTLFTGEIELLRWLKANSVSLPVPCVRSVVRHSHSEPYTFAIMEKMPGDCMLNVFGSLPFDIKEAIVRNTAVVMLELNGVVVPQRIGTTRIHEGIIDLVPLVSIIPGFSSSRVFDTLEECLYSLVRAKRDSDRIGSDDASRVYANAVLDRLAEKLPSILQRLSSPTYRRCILSHDDLNETNVLASNDGTVTGVVDWEYHSVRPVVLAAQYPRWLRYDGVYDPCFAPGENWWTASPQDATRLRVIYAEIIKSQDEDYWRALINGEVLRQIYEWVTDTHVDPGCAAMARWMDETFGPPSPKAVAG